MSVIKQPHLCLKWCEVILGPSVPATLLDVTPGVSLERVTQIASCALWPRVVGGNRELLQTALHNH